MISFSSDKFNTQTKSSLKLAKNEIHIWTVSPEKLKGYDDLLTRYTTLLTPTELAKQQRYKFANDQHDALITRAFVRDLLSYYADTLPQDWQFEKGEKEKPEIINCPLPLRFNISHTKNLIICAVTLEDDIGCDVENISRDNDVLAIADRYFSSSESYELFSLPKALQRDRFFDYWTLKESYIKAWGLGLAIPLADFSFHINDSAHNHNEHFVIKEDIQLSFAKHRNDEASIWRSWLIYPEVSLNEMQEHRIALSLRSLQNKQNINYQLRFFQSIPLIGYSEI